LFGRMRQNQHDRHSSHSLDRITTVKAIGKRTETCRLWIRKIHILQTNHQRDSNPAPSQILPLTRYA
jgi:hypothetical protein